MRVRSMFAAVSQAWRTLTQIQVQDWNTLASETTYQNRLGDSRNYTGKALFQKVNQNRELIELGILKNAPNFVELPGILAGEGSIEREDGDLSITFGASLVDTLTNEVNSGFILSATPPIGVGTKYVKNRLRDLTFAIGLTGDTINQSDFADSSEALGEMYQNKFGTPEEGEKIVIALTPVNVLGQKGVPYPIELNFQ